MKMWWRITATILFCLVFVSTLQVYAEETQEDETAKRIEKAKQLGLEEWIDEEGYLLDKFYAGKSDSEISNMSLDGLVRVMTEEEIQAYTDQLNAGISLLTVTYYKKTGQINPDTGRPIYTGMFEVDGILAFCIEREEITPAKGDATGEWIPVDNENMRKVLYYGYNGPADCGYTFVETAMALAEANGKGDNSLGVAILAEIVLKELPPDDFYVWKVQTNDGNTQDLAFYTYEQPNVKIYLTKYSEGFSEVLPGARFKHTDPEGMEDVMESDENGEILWENLKPGIHQIEEIEAPDGYIRSQDLIVVNVNDENQIEVVSETEAIIDVDGNLHVSVENKIGYELPNTGSGEDLLLRGLGILFLAASLGKERKNYMKKTKVKWLCMALAAANIMMFGNYSGTQVYAAEQEATITIRGNADQSMIGKEFSVYQLMTAENSEDGKSIDYTMNEKYSDSLKKVVAEEKDKEPEEVTEYEVIDYMQSLNINETDYADEEIVLEGSYSQYRYFIEKVMAQIVSDGLKGDVVVDVTETQSNNTVVISGLEYGYYLVQDTSATEGNHTAVSMLMVSTANPNFQVNIKADYPVVTKKVQEDDGGEWSDIADFEIGQEIPFKYESNIPNMNGYSKYYYAWHDRMDDALTLKEDSIVITITGTLNGEEKTYTLNAVEYDLLTDVENESFVIEVEDIKRIVDREFPAKNADNENVYGQTVLVSYTANLNDVAALDTGKPGFENDVRLEFSNNPWVNFEDETGFTPWDTVVCFTYTLDGVKVNNYGTELEGAKFRLYTDEACTNEVYVKKIEERFHVINEDSYYGTPENAVEIVSSEDGTFSVYGLDSGTYYLKETEAPAGYRPILDPIKLVISANFPEDLNAYVKGEGAEDSVLNLSAVAKTKVYVNGEFREKEVALEVDQERGSLNLSVVNDIGKKLPITGSYAVPVLMGIGVTMVFVSFKNNQKKHE